MHVCFCCVRFSFSVLSQEIGWEERLRNDLFCVEWDVERQLDQSIWTCASSLDRPKLLHHCTMSCPMFRLSTFICLNHYTALVQASVIFTFCISEP